MHSMSTVELAAAAALAEAAIGYPSFIYRAMGHPVTWMGRLLGLLERRMNRETDTFGRRRLAGAGALVILLAASAGAAFFFLWFVSNGLIGIVLTILAATSLIAQRSMYDH